MLLFIIFLDSSHQRCIFLCQATWTGYDLTRKGRSVLEYGPIVLPVPASVREFENKQKAALQDSLSILEKAGVNLDQIPKAELEEGGGEVLKALKTWYNYLDYLQRQQKSDRVDQLDDLKLRLEAWRSDMAVKFRMSPVDVMPEHLLVKVAYAAASLKTGNLEKEALLAVGVRSGGINDLESTITTWLDETRQSEPPSQNVTNSSKMIIQDGIFKPAQPWEHFSYKPHKKTGLAFWESSYNRFMNGEHPQAIAMSPVNGRPIQITTVVSHIFDGLLSGRKVDLKRLSIVATFPTKEEWEMLKKLEHETQMDVTGDPQSSGKDSGPFRMTDFLSPIMGDSFASKDYGDRTEEEKSLFFKWCELLKCYMTLRRIGYTPSFDDTD